MTTQEAGRLGGQARAIKLSGTKRQEIARVASRKRWAMLSPKDTGTNHQINPFNSNWCDTHGRSLYRCQQLDIEQARG